MAIFKLLSVVISEKVIGVAQILQGLSYKASSIVS